ncbi:RnfABCDGE type electron transport complex subunit D [Sediminispirochaeta bajacaliforniensis]|uniref:RnfABCDGE type electron transport complex subunit D n=1 Tax=Sediminispirochaeta bajacaliforniensis TaxID=148 RepID=UPI000477BE44|nr:RnfABCDGE type electron transport complex subunit D [Sediminispirochaeta bajacaliforniensis]
MSEKNKEAEKIMRLVESSPQIHNKQSTSSIMWSVTLALLPAAAWGIYLFGARALTVLLVSIAAAVVTEAIIAAFLGRFTLFDGSAVLTGLLIGFNMPTAVPFYVPILGSVFAIAVVKWTFGGLGGNWMNPALAGRVFVFFSWTGQMTSWSTPKTVVDAVSSATPLGMLKTGLLDYSGPATGPAEFLSSNGFVGSTSGLSHFFAPLFGGGTSGKIYADLFTGNVGGCIGEVSALLLIIGALYLFAKKIITWQIPVAYLGSFALLVWIFGGNRYGTGAFSGDVLFHLFSGGIMLGALYMATDMVTSPLTGKGMIIYGVGIGFLTFLIRFYGSFPEGVSLAIILMNIFVPMINRYNKPHRFGVERKSFIDRLKEQANAREEA